MKKYILSIIATIVLIMSMAAFSAWYYFSGISWVTHTQWVFSTMGNGNAGNIDFSANLSGIDGTTLTGSFSLETVWLVTFNSDARIIPPASWLATDLWTTTGTIDSPYAGMIYLNSGSTYQTNYDPVNRILVGNGWNLWIGRIPFTITSGSSQGFLGKVKIFGNISSQNAFDTLNPLGPKFSSSVFSKRIDTVRKNVTILSRNLPDSMMNTSFGTLTPLAIWNKIFFINTTSTPKTLYYSSIKSSFPTFSVDSIIVIGGDIIIDDDITTVNTAKWMIALKNSQDIGWNIVITKNVKIIKSSMIAEWSLYSGDSLSVLYNDTTEKVALLSKDITNQLYVHGIIISHNTIGGSIQSSPVCVYNENNCTSERAIRYDFNYFRGYDASSTANRAYTDSSLDLYSFIIEHDSRVLSNPPPGFEF
jgi:hypothetical protein